MGMSFASQQQTMSMSSGAGVDSQGRLFVNCYRTLSVPYHITMP